MKKHFFKALAFLLCCMTVLGMAVPMLSAEETTTEPETETVLTGNALLKAYGLICDNADNADGTNAYISAAEIVNGYLKVTWGNKISYPIVYFSEDVVPYDMTNYTISLDFIELNDPSISTSCNKLNSVIYGCSTANKNGQVGYRSGAYTSGKAWGNIVLQNMAATTQNYYFGEGDLANSTTTVGTVHHFEVTVKQEGTGAAAITVIADGVKLETTNTTTLKQSRIGFYCWKDFSIGIDNIVVTNNATNETLVNIDFESEITGAQVALGTDATVNYYATVAADQKAIPAMRFTMNGKTQTVTGVKTANENEYVFSYTGIAPQSMGDNIKAELLFGNYVADTVEEYSVLKNCQNLLAKSAEELGITEAKYTAMKTLIADLLEYGAQAQSYTNYETDALVNQNVTGQTAFTALTNTQKKLWSGDATREGTKFVAAGVNFDYVNKLYFKFTAPDVTESNFSVTVTAGDKIATYKLADFEVVDAATSTYAVFTDAIAATGFDTVYTVALVNGEGKTIQSLQYSVNSYVYAKQATANTLMAKLAQATYNYGQSAVAYNNAK